MSAEPQKFFIGVIDLFSVLLPGALGVYLIKDQAGPALLGSAYTGMPPTEAWSVFLVASYLLGHFVFLIGAWLLDDAYDRIRNATPQSQISRLAKGKRLSSAVSRRLAHWLFPKENDRAVRLAVRLKEAQLGRGNADAINAFQWSKARLMLHHSDALAIVQRFEADSKFFRSLQVVLGIVLLGSFAVGEFVVAMAAVPLFVLAFWRYADQRLKATNQAYWLVISEAAETENGISPAPARVRDWTHAGGVVVRAGGAGPEYLLVRPTNAAAEWVLPKGHIEIGEQPEQTAVREVNEETGVWARIQEELRDVSYTTGISEVRAVYYLMEHLTHAAGSEERAITWLPFERALDAATHIETRELLRIAHQRQPLRLNSHPPALA